jgi:carboxypeptidase Q
MSAECDFTRSSSRACGRWCALFLLLFSSLAAAASVHDPSSVGLGRRVQKDSQAFRLLTELTSTIGPRLSATDRGARAEEFVHRKLQSFGLKDVRFEPFSMQAWNRGTAELLVNGSPICTAAMVYTPSHADLTAPIVDAGVGNSADYADNYDKVRGKIALIYMGTLADSPAGTARLPRWERLALAMGHGATGVVFINPSAGHHITTGIAGGSARVVPIPVVVIDKETGLDLRSRLQRGEALEARIQVSNAVSPGEARNVIATIAGAERPEEVIVLAGHLDSLDLATGAVDDGAGAMWVLDVARAFAKNRVRPKRTVQFIFFMGEEDGLLGSYFHVRRTVRENTLGQVRYMINADMSISPTGLRLWGGDPDLNFFRSFAADVRALYPTFVDISTESPDMSLSSDSQPYIERGVPIVYPMTRWADGLLSCTHAECDDMRWVTDQQMRRSAVIGAMLLARIANAPEGISHVMTAEETSRYFETNEMTLGYRGPAED